MYVKPFFPDDDATGESEGGSYWSTIYLQERAAENPSTSPVILRLLAACVYVSVRMGVANNPNASPDILLMLALDKSFEIRLLLAEKNIDRTVLNILVKDSQQAVSERAQKTLERIDSTIETTELPDWVPYSQSTKRNPQWVGTRTERTLHPSDQPPDSD